MTELSFLVELLLNHKLPKATKELVAARIKEVEESFSRAPVAIRVPLPPPSQGALPPHIANQTPSMQKIMLRNLDLIPQEAPTIGIAPIPPASEQATTQPVAIVAQTAATVAAMNARQQAINESLAGKIDKTTGRPRKF